MIKFRYIRFGIAIGITTAVLSLTFERRTSAFESLTRLARQKSAETEKPAEQVYKNIQVLSGLPASELDGAMAFMAAALGVGCTHCHTNPWDSDAKSAKLAARRMIAMTRALNKDSFNNIPAVTCYTCHRGQHNTQPVPPVELATTRARDDTVVPDPTTLPSTDEVIVRYIKAIGGEAAIAVLKTRISRGSETTTNRMTPPQSLPIEILQAAPDKLLISRTSPRGTMLEGFDGSHAWTKDPSGHREMTGKELAVTKREADFFRYLKIRDSYPQMRVLAKEKVGERETFVVGATSREDSRERLYFDVENGLLIRRFVAFKTALGSIPEVTDFGDYREVNGVKLPFLINWSRPPFGFVRKFNEIQHNSNIDTGKFQPDAK